MDWNALKSGSDIRGTAVGEGTILTTEVAQRVGRAFAEYLAEQKGKNITDITVSLGRDSRISGPDLLNAAADGIRSAGATAILFHLCTTPAMFMSTITPECMADGAVMITASHHPWNKNGMKFFTNRGGLEGSEISLLLEKASLLSDSGKPCGRVKEQDFLSVYMNLLEKRIRDGLQTDEALPLRGLHVAVDAGNGAGGFYADLLQRLGANTDGSQFLNPDGYFPNHIPNPENKNAMESLSNAVSKSHADLGAIFDADCDRAAVADADGKGINRNRLIALISSILLEKESGLTIVTDSVTSSGLKKFIEEHGGSHYRYKRGYRNVIDEAIRLNSEGSNCPLAIETSGHAALRENHFLDDGMYLVTVLIVKAMQLKKKNLSLGSLIADLEEPVEATEVRMNITDPDFRKKGQEIIAYITEQAERRPCWHVADDNREGIRISTDLAGKNHAGWFLLRLSVHDPVMPLNIESDISGGVKTMLTDLYTLLENQSGLDLHDLSNACRN